MADCLRGLMMWNFPRQLNRAFASACYVSVMGGTGILGAKRVAIMLLIAAWLFMCTVVIAMYGPVVGAFIPYLWMIAGLPFVVVGLTPLAPLGVIALFVLCVAASIQRIVTGKQVLLGIHGLGICAFLSLAAMFPPSYA